MKVTSNIYALQKKPSQNFKSQKAVSQSINNTNNQSVNSLSNVSNAYLTNVKTNNIVTLSFTGNAAKNPRQFLFLTPEVTGFFNETHNSGGMGVVNKELPDSLIKHYGADVRTVTPYHSYDNESGALKTVQFLFDKNGEPEYLKDAAGNLVLENNYPIHKYVFKEVPIDYQIPKENEGREFFAMLGKNRQIDGKDARAYKLLDDLGISGTVKQVNDDLTGLIEVPYRIFKGHGDKKTTYVIHTPGTGSWSHCYNENGLASYSGSARQGSGSSYQSGFHDFQDYEYGIFDKAFVNALPKLADETGENFNPRSIELSDRHAFISLAEITEASAKGINDNYWRGIHIDGRYHNPSDGYQGAYRLPTDFFKIVATEEDLKNLQEAPGYDFVLEMLEKIKQGQMEGKEQIEELITPQELKKMDDIFEPFIGQFRDSLGRYNLCKLAIVNKQVNPRTFEHGTVSRNYGEEMASANTPDVAKSLTDDFAGVRTIDIVNGSTPANLGLDKGGRIGKGLLNTGKYEGYTPLPSLPSDFSTLSEAEQLKIINDEADTLFEATQKNKKWLLDILSKAYDETQQGDFKDALSPLEKLFFEEGMVFDIKDGKTVKKQNPACILGSLSEYKEGDVLLTSWGRGVEQKGYPASLEGLIQYLKSSAPEAEKRHVKFLVGGGGWTEEELDFQLIKAKIKEIEDMGYKGQVMYVNGWFPNKLIACSDYAFFTSRYEPCGITPLEAFSAGKPVISHHTGGAPDFITPIKEGIKKATGFLTKDPYLLTRKAIEQSGVLSKEEIEDAIKYVQGFKKDGALTAAQELDAIRLAYIGKQNANCIQEAVNIFVNKPEEYKQMSKNARKLQIDWHNNGVFNHGICADELYISKVFKLDPVKLKPNGVDEAEPMKKLIGSWANKAYGQTKEAAGAALSKEEIKEIVQDTVDSVFERTKQANNSSALKAWDGLGKTGQLATVVFGSIIGLIGLVKYCDYKEAKAIRENR